VAKRALEDPHILDDHLEQLEAFGFGEPALDGLAKEIIRLRLEADVLDTEALQRHLAARGFGALISEIDKAARNSSAPFLDPDFPLPAARTLWSQAFGALTRLAALDAAVDTGKRHLPQRSHEMEVAGEGPSLQIQAVARLKAERDALRRAITSGTIWETTGS
jgi:DNA primase